MAPQNLTKIRIPTAFSLDEFEQGQHHVQANGSEVLPKQGRDVLNNE